MNAETKTTATVEQAPPASESAVEQLTTEPVENQSRRRAGMSSVDLTARGEPFLWGMGGALVLGILMVIGFLLLIFWNGIITFYPKPLHVVKLHDGSLVAGEPFRHETYKPGPDLLATFDAHGRAEIEANQGLLRRVLYRTGNFDLYNEDFKWVPDYQIQELTRPADLYFIERMEWGPFVGFIKALALKDDVLRGDAAHTRIYPQQKQAAARRDKIHDIQRNEIGLINHQMERERLKLRKVEMEHGADSPAYQDALQAYQARNTELEAEYARLEEAAQALKTENEQYTVTLADVNGEEKTLLLSDVVRLYPPNQMNVFQKLGVYVSRWAEFLTQEPREANTEGGVLPAIFGTFVMTVLMALAVAPFGVMAALYLREYARQGRLVSIVRICVNNLAGVPSIVYGVFGLGFFAYILGGSIDQMFFAERLPNPTFGTGGLLWASLTLALLTVPVVIVSTEEALAAVPKSLREGSLACGASKWQTIKYIVLPKALPGIMTGLILAMARGAGEVAPLMLVGVVKIAPALPIDRFFPFVHLERSFMHLGFHIFDVGFQSRNSEAGKPMVFVTTLLLIALVAVMNATAIYVRNQLKKKYHVGHF
jgi:phosphate transport system permease protein